VIHQHLADARQALQVLPDSTGRDGLAGLLNFLAKQSDALGV